MLTSQHSLSHRRKPKLVVGPGKRKRKKKRKREERRKRNKEKKKRKLRRKRAKKRKERKRRVKRKRVMIRDKLHLSKILNKTNSKVNSNNSKSIQVLLALILSRCLMQINHLPTLHPILHRLTNV